MERDRVTAICAVFLICCALTLPITPATPQQWRSTHSVKIPRISPRRGNPPIRWRVTPRLISCEHYRSHPHPGMQCYCQGLENMTLRSEAHRQGRPSPPESIIELPALGIEAARVLGHACVSGQAFKKLPSGW